MPPMLQNPDSAIQELPIESGKYDYEYPNKLDLRPNSDLHKDLVRRLVRYGWESNRIISARRHCWDDMNDKLTAYMPADEKEQRVRRKDKRKPISIVFPYSYAIMETMISYLVAAFFPEPMFRFEGVGPEDVGGALLLQNVINLHVNRMKCALNLHTMFRDATAYGLGVVSPQWAVKTGNRYVKKETGVYDMEGAFTANGFTRVLEEDVVLFEGNSLCNIDPYCYLPDPNYPIHEPQRGEYVGWVDRSSYMDLLADEMSGNDPDLFNVKYLQHMHRKATVILGTDADKRSERRSRNYDNTINRNISDPVDMFHIYVKLIPSQWKIGDSDRPQKWLFSVAGDSVIIRAKPLGLHHNMFPVAVSAPDFDGYSPVSYSRLEILAGMQTTIDWLFNSHIANVRKAINDVLIVDPFLVNIEDLREPEAGGLVRLRRPAWGKGVENVAKQLAITDITANNMADVALIINYMQQVSGSDNPMMGNLRQGGPERLSAREFQGTKQGAVSRMERVAKIVGLQGFQDIGYQFAHNTQQLMEEDTYIRTVGEWPQTIQEQFKPKNGRVLVTPFDLLVDYDVLTRDGTIPGGNFSDAWVQIFQTIGNSELLIQRFDIVRIFEYIATQLGAKNVAEFRLQQAPPQVTAAPDEGVEREVERGNLIPMAS